MAKFNKSFIMLLVSFRLDHGLGGIVYQMALTANVYKKSCHATLGQRTGTDIRQNSGGQFLALARAIGQSKLPIVMLTVETKF